MLFNICKQMEEANARNLLFEENEKILVALSGGADSVALICALKKFYPALELFACHVNHMLRAEEADRDADFVADLCKKLGVPLEMLKTDVGAYAKKSGLSTELAARNVRYDFFGEVCRKHGINKVATAHTLSDNTETVLFNLARGASLKGLCGIPAKRPLSEDIFIIRPLIYTPRSDIEEFLSAIGQPFVTDSTNLTDDYTRNYFRHNIVPLFKKINPSFEESIKNTCVTLKDTQIFIHKTANNIKDNKVSVLAELDDCILSNVIVELFKDYTGKHLLENVHINAVAGLIKRYDGGVSNAREICLPDGISAVIDGGRLVFCPTERNKSKEASSYNIPLEEGLNLTYNGGFAVALSRNENYDTPKGYELYARYKLSSSHICTRLYMRTRASGDTIKSGGMSKKVKSLFTKSKTADSLRSLLPFICDDDGILIIPGLCVCDKLTRTEFTEENNLLYIYVYSPTTL